MRSSLELILVFGVSVTRPSFYQVKVDAKTKSLLDEHKMKKKIAEKDRQKDSEAEEGETKGSDDEDDDVGEAALQEDETAKNGLNAVMQEYADDLRKDPPGGD